MKKILIALFLVMTALLVIDAVPALAQGGAALEGLDVTAKQAQYTTGEQANLTNVIAGIIRAILGILGIVFALLMIYGGVTWMTAQGNEENVKKAKDTLIAATIGLIIIVASYAIASFVIDRLAGVTDEAPPGPSTQPYQYPGTGQPGPQP